MDLRPLGPQDLRFPSGRPDASHHRGSYESSSAFPAIPTCDPPLAGRQRHAAPSEPRVEFGSLGIQTLRVRCRGPRRARTQARAKHALWGSYGADRGVRRLATRRREGGASAERGPGSGGSPWRDFLSTLWQSLCRNNGTLARRGGRMHAGWLWGAALLCYGAFSLWYNNLRGPLRADEIDRLIERAAASSNDRARAPRDRARLPRGRRRRRVLHAESRAPAARPGGDARLRRAAARAPGARGLHRALHARAVRARGPPRALRPRGRRATSSTGGSRPIPAGASPA